MSAAFMPAPAGPAARGFRCFSRAPILDAELAARSHFRGPGSPSSPSRPSVTMAIDDRHDREADGHDDAYQQPGN